MLRTRTANSDKKGLLGRSDADKKTDKKEKKDKTDKKASSSSSAKAKPSTTAAVMTASASALAPRAVEDSSKHRLSQPIQPAAQKRAASPAASASAPASSVSAAAAAASSGPAGSRSTPAAASKGVAKQDEDQQPDQVVSIYMADLLAQASLNHQQGIRHADFKQDLDAADEIVRRQLQQANAFTREHTALMIKYGELIDQLDSVWAVFNQKARAFATVINSCSRAFADFNQRLKEKDSCFMDFLEIFRQNPTSVELQAAERMLQRCRSYLDAAGVNDLSTLLEAWIQAYKDSVAQSDQVLFLSQLLVKEARGLVLKGEQLERTFTAQGCKDQVKRFIRETNELIDQITEFQSDCYCNPLHSKIVEFQADLKTRLIEPIFPASFIDLSQPHDQILEYLTSLSSNLGKLASVLLDCLKPIPRVEAASAASTQVLQQKPFFAESASQQRNASAASTSSQPRPF